MMLELRPAFAFVPQPLVKLASPTLSHLQWQDADPCCRFHHGIHPAGNLYEFMLTESRVRDNKRSSGCAGLPAYGVAFEQEAVLLEAPSGAGGAK
jgi:hypothetical protein